MTTAQIFGLVIGTLMLAASIYAAHAARLYLTDRREHRCYRAIIDEDRAREIRILQEVSELEVQAAMSGLDEELGEILRSA